MFGRKASVTVAEKESRKNSLTPPNPASRKIISQGTAEEIKEYVALCQKIGAETPALRMFQLREFLAERGIPEYDVNKVHGHLCRFIDRRNQESANNYFQYSWYPLRKEDKKIRFEWFNGDYCSSSAEKELYNKLVPSSVLETVATITDNFPDAKFFVSDIARVKDPFLAVTFPGQWPVIVDFWNEPGFRPTK